MKRLKAVGVEVIIYEPQLSDPHFENSVIVNDLADFKEKSDLIVANRISPEIEDVRNKIYSRDLYGSD